MIHNSLILFYFILILSTHIQIDVLKVFDRNFCIDIFLQVSFIEINFNLHKIQVMLMPPQLIIYHKLLQFLLMLPQSILNLHYISQ